MRSYLGLSTLDQALFLWQLLHMRIQGEEHISLPANTGQEGLGFSSANRPQEGTGGLQPSQGSITQLS